MFKVNDYIVCGKNGVCRVVDIGIPDIGLGDSKTQYYKLEPICENGGIIYTPVDNDKIVMRKVLSEEEAKALIDSMPSIKVFTFEDERMYENQYKEAMQKCDHKEWIKIIKTSYLRKKERLSEGKKGTAIDDRYLKRAEEYLYGELAISLNIPQEQVVDFIVQQVENSND